MSAALLTLRGVGKSFDTVTALAEVDLDLCAGEVHAILGENGAGKSTLMKVIYGLLRPDAGTLLIDGVAQRFASALDARRAGIGMVHQEFALVDALSGVENLALSLTPPGAMVLRRTAVAASARRLAAQLGLELGDLDAPVGLLPVGLRQRLEIVKALAGDTRVLILDEPTAVLTPGEVRQLFVVLDRLRSAGRAVLFITHKLAEVTAMADRVTVMRRGRVVARARRGEFTEGSLAEAMVGQLDTAARSPDSAPSDGPPQLIVDALSADDDRGVRRLRAVSLQVRAGEIFGIAGVDGNGQAELFEVLSGLRPPTSGRIAVGGQPVPHFAPAALLAAGVACVPPDRLRFGVVPAMSVQDNASLNVRLLRRTARWWLDPTALRAAATTLVERYAITTAGLDIPAGSLSGGNVQKLVVGRALALEPRVLIAANPTRGLDVAAAQAVYAAFNTALARGTAVLLISTDLDEIVGRCHRLAVLSGGQLSPVLERPFATEQLAALMGGAAEAA